MFRFQLPNAKDWFYFYGVSKSVHPLIMLNLPHIANKMIITSFFYQPKVQTSMPETFTK
jgi:hypothetical protein